MGRLVCGYDKSIPGGIRKMGEIMTDKANEMQPIKSGGIHYMIGYPKGMKGDLVYNQWKGVKISREMMPNHEHRGEAFETEYKVGDNVYVYGERKYKARNRRRNLALSWKNDTNYEEKSYYKYNVEHNHYVIVGENDEKSMMGDDVIGLPRPPLIVLRYIIYWPD